MMILQYLQGGHQRRARKKKELPWPHHPSYLYTRVCHDSLLWCDPYILPPQAWVTFQIFKHPGRWLVYLSLSPRRVKTYIFAVHHAWCLHIIYTPWRVFHIFIHPGGCVLDPSLSIAMLVVVFGVLLYRYRYSSSLDRHIDIAIARVIWRGCLSVIFL